MDLTIRKNLQKEVIDLEIYYKPTSNTTAIHNRPRHPFQQKLSTFNSLIHRPITKPNYKKEIRFIEEMAVKNGFNLKTIHQLIRKHKSKQNKITALSKIETNKQIGRAHV